MRFVCCVKNKLIILILFFITIFSIQYINKEKVPKKVNTKENYSNFVENKFNLEWKIEIPKINLKAPISDGTSNEILNKYVGHFEETSKCEGNVALAAHNRGYKVNYFQRLKELEVGDIIFYTYNGVEKEYEIILKTIIKDTDWSKLENTKDNIITLITCVENQPEYRRCIQALERR